MNKKRFSLRETNARHNLKMLHKSNCYKTRYEKDRCLREIQEQLKFLEREFADNYPKDLIGLKTYSIEEMQRMTISKMNDILERLKQCSYKLENHKKRVKQAEDELYKGKSVDDILDRYCFEKNTYALRNRITKDVYNYIKVNDLIKGPIIDIQVGGNPEENTVSVDITVKK